MGYLIRTMVKDEISIGLDFAEKEGWNPGCHDLDSLYSADPEGFLIGELDGEPIATISAVKYDEGFGFLGCYIVKPEYRGQGYGIRIWDEAMKRLESRNIGLDGVIAQQENYKKSGFKLAHRSLRYEGVTGGGTPEGYDIVDASALSFKAIESYDRLCFPDVRTSFLKAWLKQPEGLALGIIGDGKIGGYGVIRKCHLGYKVGPLFVDTPEVAEALFCALKSRVEVDQPVYLDIPEVNRESILMAERHGMEVMFETARMYTGSPPVLSMERIFGITSFELG